MMDWSDTHCRYFWRLLTRRARLYTEMVTTAAIIHGDRDRFLNFNDEEHPLALQLGGSNPTELLECARMAEDRGFDEINLNCGCPSDRVQNGKIGAVLMTEPERVADCIAAMAEAVSIPVTVKHRLGVDALDSEEHLHNFVAIVAQAGCKLFIVHARKAWLSGLSPKENREVPPLQYDRVIRLKAAFPALGFVLNGGIKTLADAQKYAETLDGVMIGREAYQNPFILSDVDRHIYGCTDNPRSRDEVLAEFSRYCAAKVADGRRISAMTRHVMGLYHGQSGGRIFRRYISEHANRPDADARVLLEARHAMREQACTPAYPPYASHN